MPKPTRKLAAIMFTDIAGYTALAAHDEEKALELIETQREILQPIVAEFNGEWLKEIGDGLLLSFPSSKQAVNCAIKIQQTVKEIEDLNLRIGIHQGDILEKGGDVFGDDVNIASRIEPFAAIGGVAITRKVEEDISSSPEFSTKYIGQPKLKGVRQVVKVYCITSHSLPKTRISEVSAKLEDEKGLLGRRFREQLTIKNIAVVATATWLFINSLQFIFANLSLGNLSAFTLKPYRESMRMGVMDFEARFSDVEVVLLQAVKSELYKYLQRHRKLMLIGDFELDQIDVKSLSRKEISKKLNSDFLVSGYLMRADDNYLVDSELYLRDGDHIATHYSQSFPVLSLQETSRLIADSLSIHFMDVLGLSMQQPVTPTPATVDAGFTLFSFLRRPIIDIEGKTKERVEITHSDEVYRTLVQGRQLLNKNTLEDNLNGIVLFETALLYDGTNGDIISLLAEAYYQRGQLQSGAIELFSKAEELLTKAIASSNVSTEALATAHYLMSKILLDRDDLTQAKASIRKARKLNRSDPQIQQQFKEITRLYLQKLGG